MKIPTKSVRIDLDRAEPIEGARFLPQLTLSIFVPVKSGEGRYITRRFIDFYYDARLSELRSREDQIAFVRLNEDEMGLLDGLLTKVAKRGSVEAFTLEDLDRENRPEP